MLTGCGQFDRAIQASALSVALLLVQVPSAAASHHPHHACIPTDRGVIECHWTGDSSGGGAVPATPVGNPVGPFFRVGSDPVVGQCWLWASSPPGIPRGSAHDGAGVIVTSTMTRLPPCPGTDLWQEAWEVYRSFPLAAPQPLLQPPVGITNLPSYLSAPTPTPIRWAGTLPSGVEAQVEARVISAQVDWGEGAEATYPPEVLLPYPEGSATYTYLLKTCPPAYRESHPSGPNCHPNLEAYPLRVTFRWFGRFRVGGPWVDLGVLERSASVSYDVDEVVGVLQPLS